MTDKVTAAPVDGPQFGATSSVENMPAHWLMAQLGKRVLRPGGQETTRWLLEHARIGAGDDVVEFAPGLGLTSREILARGPLSYVGVERDEGAVRRVERVLARADCAHAKVLCGDAENVPLADGSASLVVGEAMLSMHPAKRKRAIAAEAHRLLRPGGRYAIHELAVTPDDHDPEQIEIIQKDLSRAIRVGVRIGPVAEWKRWLQESGFEIESTMTAPMSLLEPSRLIRDEGPFGTLRLIANALRTPGARQRLLGVRAAFRAHAQQLCAVAIVARRVESKGAPT